METLGLPKELQDVVQSALEGMLASTTATSGQSEKPEAPQSSRLMQAIYFSRKFVSTYLIVLLAVVLVGTVRHSYITRSRKQHNKWSAQERAKVHTPLSESSTLFGEEPELPKDGSETEHTSLLGQQNSTNGRISFVGRLRCRTTALFMHQPKPVPALTASSNQLPSNGISGLVVAFCLLNVFYLLYNVQFSWAMVFAFAHRAGFLFIVNIPVIYVLGAKNNQPLKHTTGWSYEKLNIYHRRLGEWMIILALLHGGGMVAVFYTIIKPFGYTLGWFISLPIIAIGLSALACYVAIWSTSIGYVREKAYESFLASHIFLQVAALTLLFFHHRLARPYVGVALAIWTLDRVVCRLCMSSRKFVATLEIAQDKTTVLLYCDIPIDKTKRTDIRSGWRAGQHVFVSVPGMRWHHAYQAHPFTIASPAPSANLDKTSWPLQLTIRCKDGFSKDLLAFAEFHQHAEIYIDGPYGDSRLEHTVLSSERVCLIAGGSGIAVTYPLAWSLWTRSQASTVVSNRTIYRNGKKQVSQIELQSSLQEKGHMHLWIRRSSQHGNWITMFPASDMDRLKSSDASQLRGGVNLISQAFNTSSSGTANRPDIATEVRLWVEENDSITRKAQQPVCLVVSGPDSLVRDVRNCAALLVKNGFNIDLHVEKFGW